MGTNLVACLMAEGVSIDSITARLTAFNMLEVIFTKSFPAILPKLFVLTVYESEGEPERFHERVSVVDPAGKTIISNPGVEIAVTAQAHNSINALWGMRFDESGTYTVKVEHAPGSEGPWRQVGKRILTVTNRAHPLFPKAQDAKGSATSQKESSQAVMVE